MNRITLHGTIRNIRPSHEVHGVAYSKAEFVVQRADSKADVLDLRFSNKCKVPAEGEQIDIVGNIRSHSAEQPDGHKRSEIYVYTRFELPSGEATGNNQFDVTGKICKKDDERTTVSGKKNTRFVIASNIPIGDNKRISAYLPCVAWGSVSKKMKDFSVTDSIHITGELHSREYKKTLENGDVEIRLARELVVHTVEPVAEDAV